MRLITLMLVAIGGAIGSVLRYLMSTGIYNLLGKDFPYGTLAVNVLGSFLIGFLSILILDRFGNYANEMRNLLLIGLLGGFTTFSSFSMETLNLIESGEMFRALLNVILSIILCLFSVWIGVLLAREL